MAILAPVLFAALILVGRTTASAPTQIVSEPHKYFVNQIHQAVDKANAISLDAVPYDDQYPTIDISPWIDPSTSTDEERQDVVNQVLEQAIGAGSFNIVGHGVTVESLDRLDTSTSEFFAQSSDYKRQFSTADAKAGYKATQEEKYGATVYKTNDPREREGDLREIYGVVCPRDFPGNVEGPEYFQSALDEYIDKLQPVEHALSQIFSAALSLAKGVHLPLTYFHDVDEGSTGLLRAHRYPAMPSEYGSATKLLPHSDFGTLTILYGSEKGLEEIRDGRWIEVPTNKEKGELHVTIGEVYTMWSNELFAHNIHRVSKRAVDDRISFAYFLKQGNSGTAAASIEPVCAKNELPKFPRSSAAMHLEKFISYMMKGESLVE